MASWLPLSLCKLKLCVVVRTATYQNPTFSHEYLADLLNNCLCQPHHIENDPAFENIIMLGRIPPVPANLPTDFRIFTLAKVYTNPTRFDPITISILRDLYELVVLSDRFFLDRFVESDRARITDRWAVIQSRLLSLSKLENKPDVSNASDIYKCCLLASVIYASRGLSAIPFSYVTCERRIVELIISLKRTDLTTLWQPLSGALLWCLFIGASFSRPGREKSWFMVHLWIVVCAFGFDQWKLLDRSASIINSGLNAMKKYLQEKYELGHV
jgi:hypothetical protein